MQQPRLRPVLEALGAYRPGRRPAPGQDLSRLASNETPYPLLPSVRDAIAAAVADANRYPDPAAQVLTEALAAKHGVFIYERDIRKLAHSLAAFDALICAYTALLADTNRCARKPSGFPAGAGWIHYPE